VHNPGGRQDDKYFATAHEYMLVYAKNKEYAEVGYLDLPDKKLKQYKYEDDYGKYKLRDYRRSGANSRPEERPNLWYPIYISPNGKEISLDRMDNYSEILPIDPNGINRVWRWEAETLMEKKDKYIKIERKDGQYVLKVKERLEDSKGQKPKTVWSESYYSSAVGTAELKSILGKEFNGKKIFEYPKSKFLIKDILEICSKKDSVILDFFAGSGTTGHAVLELNKKDNGKRTFILCTNNENDICSKVCYPRLKKSILGYKTKELSIPGLSSNLRYMKTAFVQKTLNEDELKIRITQKCIEMLCVKTGIYKEIVTCEAYKIFSDTSGIMAIYMDIDRSSLTKLKEELDSMSGKKRLFCFTLDSAGLSRDDFMKWDDVELEPIPQGILDIYGQMNGYNA